VTVYPQLGVHTYSASYVQYFYGLNRVEAARSGYASYRPGSAVDPLAGAFIDTSIGGRWHVDVSLRHERLGRAIADSPIVARHGLDTALLVLAYHLP
jgi:outer membrane protein